MIPVDDILAAHKRIGPHVLKTPLFHSLELSERNRGEVYLKLESEQYTGSFKARGALNKILTTPVSDREQGFLTASTGNHAQGFARGIGIAGCQGKIFLPTNADPSKVAALKKYDVELDFHGTNSLEAELHAKAQAEKSGMVWISPYDDHAVIAGQATIGLEVMSELEDIDAVLGCIGGGGMMSGIGSWFKQSSPKTKVIGCLPELAPEMYLSVMEGRVVSLDDPQETLSDGSAGGLEEDAITFDICKAVIDDFLIVSEKEIAEAIKLMAGVHHKIIEGAAGVALASFLNNTDRFSGQRLVIVICGSNISLEKFKALL